MRRKTAVGLIFLLVLLLCGCTRKDSVEPPPAPVEEPEAREPSFIFVCPLPENVYWQDCLAGIRQADAELGTHTIMVGPEDAATFAVDTPPYMQQAIEARPDGILCYGGIEAMHPLIDQAVELGIPVLTVDNDAPDTSRLAYVGTDVYELGYESGQKMAQLTGGIGKIGYVCSTFSAEGEAVMFGAFKDAINDYDLEVVAQGEGFVDIEYCAGVVREMLAEHPEITAIFCTGGHDIAGAAAAVESLGRDDLILVGTDDTELNLSYVRSGVINALLAQDPEQMGYQGVYRLKEYLNRGKLDLTEYYTDCIVVTRVNVDSYRSASPSVGTEAKTVRVGYYTDDSPFQGGFSDGERKVGYAYEYYQAIAPLVGWQYEYVYGSRDEIIEKLISGEVDITAGIYNTNLRKDQVHFSQLDMGLDGAKRYFVVSQNRTDLLTDLNYAMSQIQKSSPELLLELKQKYYSSAIQQPITVWEREWLAERGALRLGYVQDAMPFSGQENGEPAGFVSDLIQRLGDSLRVPIEPICYPHITDLQAGLANREIDVAFPMYSDEWLWESKGFRQTESFINDRVMVIYSGSYSNTLGSRVALSQTGIGQRYFLQAYYPESQNTFYDSVEDALEAVSAEREECIIGCSSILQRFLSGHPKYNSLNIAYLDTSESFGMGVRQEDSLLAGILNKAIRQMDSTAVSSTIMRYSSAEYRYSLRDVIQQYAIAIILILCTFFAILAWTFISYWRRVKLFNRQQAITQKALEEALEAADSANRAKTTFLSSMSHDIRTPMNAIVGMTTIAERHLDDRERVADCLKKITLSSHHLLTLINDVLDISKIESGKLTLNPVVFSLRDTMATMVNIIQPQLKAKSLEFEAHIHGMEYEKVNADEVRVNQVFINLLTNAVKYTPEGGRVSVDLAEEALSDGGTVRLTYRVSDTGIGMSPEFMETMYQTFSRAKDSRVNKIQGTGLGLAIVKQMVDLMGGSILCESELGKGTTFTVTLDLPIGDDPTERPPLPPHRILLVDDDELFLENASDALERMGMSVDTAQGGREAIEKARASLREERPYPLFIVDWKMPDMNGLETIQAIQAIMGSEVPMILASAYDWTEIEDAARDSGARGFISKPLFRSRIYDELKEALHIQTEQQAEELPTGETRIEGRRLLVAEDNELNWEVISELLSSRDIRADWAENGRICVERLEQEPPGTWDLVLMDVQMPVMGGLEATRIIRASERADLKTIPILAMTADAFAEDIAACMEAGMNGHVSKPVDMDKLVQELQRLLKRR